MNSTKNPRTYSGLIGETVPVDAPLAQSEVQDAVSAAIDEQLSKPEYQDYVSPSLSASVEYNRILEYASYQIATMVQKTLGHQGRVFLDGAKVNQDKFIQRSKQVAKVFTESYFGLFLYPALKANLGSERSGLATLFASLATEAFVQETQDIKLEIKRGSFDIDSFQISDFPLLEKLKTTMAKVKGRNEDLLSEFTENISIFSMLTTATNSYLFNSQNGVDPRSLFKVYGPNGKPQSKSYLESFNLLVIINAMQKEKRQEFYEYALKEATLNQFTDIFTIALLNGDHTPLTMRRLVKQHTNPGNRKTNFLKFINDQSLSAYQALYGIQSTVEAQDEFKVKPISDGDVDGALLAGYIGLNALVVTG